MNYFEQIESYFDGQMNKEQKLDFEKRMAHDQALSDEVKLYKDSISILKKKIAGEDQFNDLKRTIQTIAKKHKAVPNLVKFTPWKKASIAALFVAAAILVTVFVFQSDVALYEKYAVHELLQVQVKGEGQGEVLKAVNYFNEKNYQDAKPLLSKYVSSHSNDLEMIITLGIVNLETGDLESANSIFSNKKLTSTMFEPQAMWYKALTYLKMGEEEKCKNTLEQLIVEEKSKAHSEFSILAKGLLSEL